MDVRLAIWHSITSLKFQRPALKWGRNTSPCTCATSISSFLGLHPMAMISRRAAAQYLRREQEFFIVLGF
jgi:hypothetical protein